MRVSSARPKTSSDILSNDSNSDGLVFNPRLGLGSTDNENIALRRNHREMELLVRKQKMLGLEQEYVVKMIELNSKSAQVRYKRLTKRVSRIRSHLTEEEVREMENDVRKEEFANKYRDILRNQQSGDCDVQRSTSRCSWDGEEMRDEITNLHVADDNQSDAALQQGKETTEGEHKRRSPDSSCQDRVKCKTANIDNSHRPKTSPSKGVHSADENDAVEDIIPSLEGLLDQLHNIKPHQFYDNQRKLKLYDIQLMLEELEGKKKTFYKGVDAIINWDKKDEVNEEEEKKKAEEEENKKPQKRKTTFMRSVLRNFSMELMMKTMQYGWTDLGKCRYLRNRGGEDNDDDSGVKSLAKDSMKIQLPTGEPEENEKPSRPPIEPGFGPDGKMIRTADLLGLKY